VGKEPQLPPGPVAGRSAAPVTDTRAALLRRARRQPQDLRYWRRQCAASRTITTQSSASDTWSPSSVNGFPHPGRQYRRLRNPKELLANPSQAIYHYGIEWMLINLMRATVCTPGAPTAEDPDLGTNEHAWTPQPVGHRAMDDLAIRPRTCSSVRRWPVTVAAPTCWWPAVRQGPGRCDQGAHRDRVRAGRGRLAGVHHPRPQLAPLAQAVGRRP
jgi:hypothetical protein